MEILLSLVENLTCVALMGGGIFLVAAIFSTLASFSAYNLKEAEMYIKRVPKLFKIALILFLIGSIPSVSDVWKVRIGLIKYNLASSENITKASSEIERIGKKLECKYLGGCKEGKEEK